MTCRPPRILPCLFLAALAYSPARAAEVIPPAPTKYVTDQAKVLSQETIDGLNRQLEQFERDTSNQVVVAIYPHMQSSDDIDSYSVRVFRAWKIGQADKNRGNGVLLLIFTQDRKLRITTGYGLEGALPDFTAKQIINNEITPRFKQQDFNGGVTAGVNSIIAAIKGEYKGTGRTVGDARSKGSPGAAIFFIVIALFIGLSFLRVLLASRSIAYNGNRSWWVWLLLNMLMNSGGSSGRGGGGWSGGSGGGGWSGGGGVSGGGGSTGGGGASGSW